MELEKIAVRDEYFVKRNLYPNVRGLPRPWAAGPSLWRNGAPGAALGRRASRPPPARPRQRLRLALGPQAKSRALPFPAANFTLRTSRPQVDFYSGIVLRALDIPVSMYTVIFAVARTVGWVAQWKESMLEASKITRPRQVGEGAGQEALGEGGWGPRWGPAAARTPAAPLPPTASRPMPAPAHPPPTPPNPTPTSSHPTLPPPHPTPQPPQMYMGALDRAFVPIGRRGDAAVIPNTDDAESLLLEETASYGGYQREVKARAMVPRG
jgi:hypothetical protein